MTTILNDNTDSGLATSAWRLIVVVIALAGAFGALIFVIARFLPDSAYLIVLFVLVALPVLLLWLFVGIRAYQAGKAIKASNIRVLLVGTAALVLSVGAGFAFVVAAALLPVAAQGAGFGALNWIATACLIPAWAYFGGLLSSVFEKSVRKRLAEASTILLMIGLVLPIPDWIVSYALSVEAPQWLQTIRLAALIAGMGTLGLSVMYSRRAQTERQ